MINTWIIHDWMSNTINLYGKKEFDNFGDAREEIDKFASDLCNTAVDNGKYSAYSKEYEEAFSGICEDLYAINIDENGNKLPNTGQYTI